MLVRPDSDRQLIVITRKALVVSRGIPHHTRNQTTGASSPATCRRTAGKPLTAVEVLRRFNAPGGVASTMATTKADTAVTKAAQHSRAQLVERFTGHGARALHGLRKSKRFSAASVVGISLLRR